jgi:hypothetical protein
MPPASGNPAGDAATVTELFQRIAAVENRGPAHCGAAISRIAYRGLRPPFVPLPALEVMMTPRSAGILVLGLLSLATPAPSTSAIQLSPLGTYASGVYNQGAAEIVAHDPVTQRLFVVNGNTTNPTIDVLSVADPANPGLLFQIQVNALYGGAANSVAFRNGVLAVAVENGTDKQQPGKVVLLDADGGLLAQVAVGALPDMITFTPDGQKVLVANEGEPKPDYSVDPEGSVSIIDLSGGAASVVQADVTTVGFADFNAGGPRHGELPATVRVYGPGSTVAQDLEPEYVALSPDSKTAYASLQENNALAVIDVPTGSVTSIVALGFKDMNRAGFGLDPSDRDNDIRIGPWPVLGMYQPDGIACFEIGGARYLISANEGDAREYTALAEEARVGALTLDPSAFPDAATLKQNANLGRLGVTRQLGDAGGDGDYDALYTFGARSFSIWDGTGNLLWDSGDALEFQTALAFPATFNASNSDNAFDSRSDNKGPEPEAVEIAEIGGRTYAFIGLERIGGIMVFDVSAPTAPTFVQYVNNRDFSQPVNTAAAKDLGPEGLHFIAAEDSPNGMPMLAVANEVSGTTTLYRIDLPTPVRFATEEPGLSDEAVALGWRVVGSPVVDARLYRRPAGSTWAFVEWLRSDVGGRLSYVDRNVVPGGRYDYRLGVMEQGREVLAGEISVEFAGATRTLAIQRAVPLPGGGGVQVSFSLPQDGDAGLDVVDVQGRVMARTWLPGLRAGRHESTVGPSGGFAPGLYWVRLRQAGHERVLKTVVAF